MKHTTALVLALALGASAAVFAQAARFEWTDASGQKVFSDRPPASGADVKNFIDHRPPTPRERPASLAEAASAAAAAQASNNTANTAAAGQQPGVDPALEANKRQAEEAEAAQKQAAEQQREAQRRENCQRARDAKATLDSGQRVARINDKGERVIIDDEYRTVEQKRLQQLISENCQ